MHQQMPAQLRHSPGEPEPTRYRYGTVHWPTSDQYNLHKLSVWTTTRSMALHMRHMTTSMQSIHAQTKFMIHLAACHATSLHAAFIQSLRSPGIHMPPACCKSRCHADKNSNSFCLYTHCLPACRQQGAGTQ